MKHIYFMYYHRALICLAWHLTGFPEDGKLRLTAKQAFFSSRIKGDLGQADSSASIFPHSNLRSKA